MRPFEIFDAGTKEVNGVFAFAKKANGQSEYWSVRTIKKGRKEHDIIYKIRESSLPQFGSNYSQCWTLSRVDDKGIPIQFYVAPRRDGIDTPPFEGWQSVGGIDPPPSFRIANVEAAAEEHKEAFARLQDAKAEVGRLKELHADKKSDKKKKQQPKHPDLVAAINHLKQIAAEESALATIVQAEEFIPKKAQDKLREIVRSMTSENFIFAPSAEIHGGCAGLYDFGPIGAALKSNIVQEWRNHFIIEDDMLEVESCMVTPYEVLKTSGHVDRFADFMVKDVETGDFYRADKLLEEVIDNKIAENPHMEEVDRVRLLDIRGNADAYSQEQLKDVLDEMKVCAPRTQNALSDPEPFNLMFATDIGPSGYKKGFLRPETAQGIFTNFKKLLKFNNDQVPFAAAQIGFSFRNEIAPRGELMRVREFQMAEIEHFCRDDVNEVDHPKFKEVADTVMNFYPRDLQTGDQQPEQMTIGEAVARGWVSQSTLGYYMARTQLFMEKIGIDPTRLRFRQHKSDEMAHYANDCWDAEIHSSHGWVECVGHADRACFDLNQHSRATNQKLVAKRVYDEPLVFDKPFKVINKKKINKTFRKQGKTLLEYLDELTDEQAQQLSDDLEQGSKSITLCNDYEYEITPEMFKVEVRRVRETEKEFVPSVVEPSFGIGRIFYSLLEHSLWDRVEDENRIVLSVRPRVAPIKVIVMPLSSHKDLQPLAQDLHRKMKRFNVASRLDTSSANIGRKYSRADEMGIPFGAVVDFQSLTDRSVTIRERDSQFPQIRVPVDAAASLLHQLSLEEKTWQEALNEFPLHTEQKVL